MPPKKKNAKKNPFFYFMQEVKRNAGRPMDNTEAQEVAGAKWATMTPAQKQPYEIIAMEQKNNVQLKKYTSDGVDIEEIERQQEAEQKRQVEMRAYISKDIRTAHNYERIDKKTFFIVHVNNFCYQESEDRYFPAEIGLLAFNLRDGVLSNNVYHSLIDPGNLPIGFYHDALMRSNETHKIKPPSGLDVEDNVQQVFNEIIEFVSNRLEEGQEYPVLYVKEKYVKSVQNIFDFWTATFDENYYFKIYNLQLMFNELRSTIEQSDIVMANSFGFYEISKDVYSHVSNIACEYHEQAEAQLYCSRSIVVRQAYIICDNCCPVLNIKLIPGQHLPMNTRTEPLRSASQTSGYTRSTRRFESAYDSIRSDDTESVMSLTSRSDKWENESTISNATSTTIEDQYPALGKNRNSGNGDWISVKSGNSSRSYSGATGSGSKAGLSNKRNAAMPSMFQQMNDMSLESPRQKLPSRTNFNSPWATDSINDGDKPSNQGSSIGGDSFSFNGSQNGSSISRGRGLSRPFVNNEKDFPALGRGVRR